MTTNRGFSLRFDQMREGNPAQSGNPVHSESIETSENRQEGADSYGGPGHVRNLCFIWPDGKKLFLNYAYLVSCEFETDSNTNTIRLGFTSHAVTLKGYRLEQLFDRLMEQAIRLIFVEKDRYLLVEKNESPLVVDIVVQAAPAV